MRRVLLNNEQLKIIQESASIGDKKITFFSFESNVKKFLSDLLRDPINSKLPRFLVINGVKRKTLLDLLLDKGVLEKTEKIIDELDNNGEHKDKFSIKYSVVRKDFDRKLKKIYYKLFDKNTPVTDKKVVTEDGDGVGAVDAVGGGGATGTEFDGAGQYSSPISKPIRRKIMVTQEQLNKIVESTTTSNAGDYQYDAPVKWFGDDDEAYVHNKKGGITCDTKE